jgi:hypothetical protein
MNNHIKEKQPPAIQYLPLGTKRKLLSIKQQLLATKHQLLSGLLVICLLCSPATALAETQVNISKHAEETAKLLGIEDQVHRFIELKNSGKLEAYDKEALKLQLTLIRKVMTAGIELRTVSARLDKEITFEQQALDSLTRKRDAVVATTNNANFLQLNILSMIIDGPLEQSKNHRMNLYGNRLNIVSGLLVGGLASLALLEQRGGFRLSPADPNMLGQTLGLNAPDDEKFPPMLWNFLNSEPPTLNTNLTRRQLLIEYWKTAKVLPINIKKQATVEQVSALGPRHHRWCESIKLIGGRVTMLFDLRAMIDMLNTGLVDLLEILD